MKAMFLDYNWTTDNKGRETFALRLNTKRLPAGSYCVIRRDAEDPRWWIRKTRWNGSKGSIRYFPFLNVEEALTTGIAWARRRITAEAREDRRG